MVEMDRRNFIRTSAVVALAVGGAAALAACAPETATRTVLRVGSTDGHRLAEPIHGLLHPVL